VTPGGNRLLKVAGQIVVSRVPDFAVVAVLAALDMLQRRSSAQTAKYSGQQRNGAGNSDLAATGN